MPSLGFAAFYKAFSVPDFSPPHPGSNVAAGPRLLIRQTWNGQHTESADAISRQFDALKRGTLRWRLEKALEKGGIDEAERISDAIYSDEFLQRQPASVSSSVGNDAGKNKLKSSKKRTRPCWRFTPKQSWETKGNM
ncbi:hypothetical protein SprV_0100385700 [Sparganum proliferum]